MGTEKGKEKQTSVKADEIEELKTEGPLSEKDEVKAAERKTAKLHTNAAASSKRKK